MWCLSPSDAERAEGWPSDIFQTNSCLQVPPTELLISHENINLSVQLLSTKLNYTTGLEQLIPLSQGLVLCKQDALQMTTQSSLSDCNLFLFLEFSILPFLIFFYFSLHSILVCIWFRYIAQWPDNHILHKVLHLTRNWHHAQLLQHC